MTTHPLKTCPDGACTTVPQGFGPAPTLIAIVDAGLGLLVDNLFTWQRRRADRLHLQSLDDHMLRDIGISRADVDAEVTKPFWRP